MIKTIAALIAAGTLVAGCQPGAMGGGAASSLPPVGSEPSVASNVGVTAPGASVSGRAEVGASM